MRSFIKVFAILLCSIYVFAKLLNLRANGIKRSALLRQSALVIMFCICTGSISLLIIKYLEEALIPFCVLFTVLFLTFVTKLKPEIVTITAVISYGISNLFLIVSTFIIGILAGLVFKTSELNLVLLQLLVFMLQMLLAFLVFRIRRFKSGMPFLKSEKYTVPGLIVSLFLLFTAMLIYNNSQGLTSIMAVVIATIFIFSILVFVWYRHQLTASYIDTLRTREADELKQMLLEKDRLLEEYKAEHDKLAQIIHKDNKLIPAMLLAVKSALSSEDITISSKHEELISSLELLSRERKGILNLLDTTEVLLPSTGIVSLDAIINYMRNKALNERLGFEFELKVMLSEHIADSRISASDFCTLLADLTENAIIASRSSEGGIFINIIENNGCLCLELFDSGSLFNTEVLYKLGNERITTHAHEAGSGIGLYSTYALLKKYKASLCIEEYTEPQNGYTKKVAISFDNLNQYILKAKLDDEALSLLSARSGLTVVSL